MRAIAIKRPQTHSEAGWTREGRGYRDRASVELVWDGADLHAPQRRLAEAYWAHEAAGILPARRNYALKRALDLALAAPALALTLPLYPLIALAIRVDSRGPALYRHVRVGKDGQPFVAYKFRTMRHAPPEEARAAHLEIVAKWMGGIPLEPVAVRPGSAVPPSEADLSPRPEAANGTPPANGSIAGMTGRPVLRPRRWLPRWTARPFVVAMPFKRTSDPRITRVGRILRKLSIDELPQLINVVRGEMSLVGPRPPVPYEVERYSVRTLARLRVLPGITGQWQVEGRGQVSFDEMVEMDLDYAAYASLRRDVALILRTIPAVLRCTGAG